MAVKRKNLYLYLTLACFLGLIAIFIFDGYIGVYDNLSITAGEQEQKIEAEQWARQEKYGLSASVERGGKTFFRYEVDNRQFSGYTADIEVSVWHSQEKVSDVISQKMSIAGFDKGQLEWTVDTTELIPADLPPEQGYQYTVIIKRGEMERKTIMHINPVPYPPKPVVPPPR